MMTDRQKQFETEVKEFPKSVRKILQTIPRQAGRLSARQCSELTRKLGIDSEALMVRLLPLAKIFAAVPVSKFRVGAVAMVVSSSNNGPFDLFLGANLEFLSQPLNQTIHAEQSAALNAWHQGAGHLMAIAASEAPCGHCRQFLYEFKNNDDVMVIIPDGQNLTYRITALSDLLPDAFGPRDLDNSNGLMSPASRHPGLHLKAALNDPTVARALSAAEKSYTPYTRNYAGCCLEARNGDTFSGCYVESVAFNPSVAPLQFAVSCMNLATLEKQPSIRRVVLVEKPSTVSQRKNTEMLLGSWAPGIELEYYEVK